MSTSDFETYKTKLTILGLKMKEIFEIDDFRLKFVVVRNGNVSYTYHFQNNTVLPCKELDYKGFLNEMKFRQVP